MMYTTAPVDKAAAADAIKEALVPGRGEEARERVKQMSPLGKREKQLVEIDEELTS